MHFTDRPNESGQASEPAIQKQLYIKDFKAKDIIRTTLLVKSKEVFWNKNGKPYLALSLGDRTGDIETRVWEGAEALNETFREGDVVAVSGRVNLFQNRLQFVLDSLVALPLGQYRLDDYLPAAETDLEKAYQELVAIFQKLEDPWIQRLGVDLLTDPEIASRYKICPAAKTIHHAYIGGLLVHSLQLVKLVDVILPLYTDLNRDVLVFGAAFHDFGKIFELSYHPQFGYTDEGRLVGHIAIAVALIDRKIQAIPGFPKPLEWHLKHLVLSHHGKLEFGSPKRPHTIEAEVLHFLDSMDSKIQSIQTFMKADRSSARWTGYHKAYDQYYYKPDKYLSQDDSTSL